jgi:hypothetical protein
MKEGHRGGLMLENGADVRMIQTILGHVKPTTTEIYTHVAITKLKQVHTATHQAALLRGAERPLVRRCGHDLADGLPGGGAERTEELAVVHEGGAEHLCRVGRHVADAAGGRWERAGRPKLRAGPTIGAHRSGATSYRSPAHPTNRSEWPINGAPA